MVDKSSTPTPEITRAAQLNRNKIHATWVVCPLVADTRRAPRRTSARHTASEDDALLAYLVGTIHAARAPLIASMAMAMLVTSAAFLMTGEPVFLAHAFAHGLIGFGRLQRLAVYERRRLQELSAREVVEFDITFAVWSALYALTLGLTCYQLTAFADGEDTFALALASCTGFTLAFVTRSAGRPRTLLLQIVGVAAPQIYALVTLPVSHGLIYATLVSGLVCRRLVMAGTAMRASSRCSRSTRPTGAWRDTTC